MTSGGDYGKTTPKGHVGEALVAREQCIKEVDCRPSDETMINVYMQDGRVFHYKVDSPVKAREHAHRIITQGWRNVVDGVMEYYPVHQVLKVTFKDPMDAMSRKYEGKTRG